MKKLLSFLFSNVLTLVALFAFAAAMAVATFLENDYGTAAARVAVYEAWWFEGLMLIIALNFIGNIYRYNLLKSSKIPILLFHLAFIVIIIGAGVTRYTSREGIIRIREGQSANQVVTNQRFFKVDVTSESTDWEYEKAISLTRLNKPDIDLLVGERDQPLQIEANRYVPDAVQGLVEGEEKDKLMEIVAVTDGQRNSYFLKLQGSVFIDGHEFTFNNPKDGAINILEQQQKYLIESPESFNYIIMATQQVGRLESGMRDTLKMRALYQSDHLKFVVSAVHDGKKLDFKTTEDKQMASEAADLLFVNLKVGSEEREVILAALDGVYTPMKETVISGYHVNLSYGPKLIELPFALYLQDFQLDRYPGSVSPSSYASEVVVKDPDGEYPVRISMNNVLDHDGYRFFQASYDMDEKGTVLSVNQDFWGTQITYLGYLLMGLGMIWTLFGKQSRFRQVARNLSKLKAMFFVLACWSGLSLSAQEPDQNKGVEINPTHAEKFGELLVQDMDGRIKPINTLASEFLRKLTRRTSYSLPESGVRFNADQLFLSIHQNPEAWSVKPLIKVDADKGRLILEELGLEDRELVSFQELIDQQGNYRLEKAIQTAQRRKPSERSEQDKEIIKVDERFNILYQALAGNYLRIFPLPTAEDDMWFNMFFDNAGFTNEDSLFVSNIMLVYYRDIAEARVTGDWSAANEKLDYLHTFQQKMGERIIPEKGRIEAELLYNDLLIFNRLFPIYWLLGCFLLIMAIFKIFYESKWVRLTYLLGVTIVAIAFVSQTGNMILRWYAGGYPPWSNGYEMIILVSWALFVFGFVFFRKSDFVLPMVALFGGTLLFVAFLDWLNPEITNLVPVLKSYWLKIHVAIIVSSYAPLALCALLGVLTLVFMSVNQVRFASTISELTYINELSMSIGLFMLAIGTFLGGVWANESWGRYWAWDPKETWALISIMIYAVVLHLRLVPALKGNYTFSVASVVAFSSIVMTSFGVNYYLSGLHSYATGDPVPIPEFVYWTVGALLILFGVAYSRKSKTARS